MKTIRNLSVILIILFLSASCHHTRSSLKVSDGKNELEIQSSGEIKFNEDETAIQSISNNGYLKYRNNGKKLVVRHTNNNELKYELSNDGQKLNSETAEGKKFIAEAIQEIISTGIDSQGRIKRLIGKGGHQAVLNEVDRLKNDFTKSIYLEYLIASDSIHKNEMAAITKKIEIQIGSDFEKSKLLKLFSATQMTDSMISQAYFDAVKSIGSDFEKANALKKRIRQPLTQEQFDTALTTSNTIKSDFEKANLLKELIDQGIYEGENFSKLLSSVNHIGSDFEKANLLKKLLGKDLKTDEQWIGLINGTAQVSSDFERSNMFIQIAGRMPKNEEVKAYYMKAAKTINSEHELRRVINAVN
jgi:ferritin